VIAAVVATIGFATASLLQSYDLDFADIAETSPPKNVPKFNFFSLTMK